MALFHFSGAGALGGISEISVYGFRRRREPTPIHSVIKLSNWIARQPVQTTRQHRSPITNSIQEKGFEHISRCRQLR